MECPIGIKDPRLLGDWWDERRVEAEKDHVKISTRGSRNAPRSFTYVAAGPDAREKLNTIIRSMGAHFPECYGMIHEVIEDVPAHAIPLPRGGSKWTEGHEERGRDQSGAPRASSPTKVIADCQPSLRLTYSHAAGGLTPVVASENEEALLIDMSARTLRDRVSEKRKIVDLGLEGMMARDIAGVLEAGTGHVHLVGTMMGRKACSQRWQLA